MDLFVSFKQNYKGEYHLIQYIYIYLIQDRNSNLA